MDSRVRNVLIVIGIILGVILFFTAMFQWGLIRLFTNFDYLKPL